MLVFLGIELDSVTQTSRLPLVKVNRILQLLHRWSRKSTCTRRELESLIGHLHHACRVVRPGRTFLRRMINLLCCFRNSSHPIRLNVEFRRDLLSFFQSWNGVSFFCHPPYLPSRIWWYLLMLRERLVLVRFGNENDFLNPGPFFLVQGPLPSWSGYLSLSLRTFEVRRGLV